ncbi:multidrug ABC transporter [Alicyclobacillus contaminans]|uniref:efflux RND transporter permease subunit n=1 Tax=Alicyclobacillus contaminans TaxID=392016 RepID=UPI000419E2D8|nr:efflux RND transporter permease subunit [Alicyclobacillus contaminans]GMA51002.1 multidrug ABC transporter [Alicyclobacillus contaminans]
MKITDLSIRRPVTITMLMIAVVIVGAFAVFELPQELFPTLNLPVAAVTTSWPGASPEEMEQQVTRPVEQALQSLPGVSEIDSTSTQGSSLAIVQFNYGVDINQEVNQMRSVVSRVQNQLPSDADAPEVQQFDPTNLPIMTLALYGSASQSDLSDIAQNIVQPALQHLNGVASASTTGALTRQITVQVDPVKLNLYHLSITQVAQALSSDNVSADAGQMQKGSMLIPMHVNGQFTSPDQLLDVPISTGKGTIRLGDVADVQSGFKDVTLVSSVNGQPAVGLTITQASGANTVQVSNEVHQAVAQLQGQLPKGVHLIIQEDNAQTIRDTINTVVNHTILGFVFGVLVIMFLLRSLRTTVVVAVAIPIAVLSTFMLMYAARLSLNSITLGSLAVGLGSLVDFSIVVLESIFRARQSGLDSIEAARRGTQEVGLAVVVAAIAQICVFAPSIFVPGIAGQFFRPLSLTVSFSHIAALFVALTFTPMLASRWLRGRRFEMEETVPGKDAPFRIWAPFDWFGRGMHDLNQAYRRVLTWALGHRKTVVIGFAATMLASFMMVPLIGFELVPNVADNTMSISVTLANGTDLATTESVVKQVEALAKKNMPGIESVYTQVGGASYGTGAQTNTATIDLTFNPQEAKQIATMANRFSNQVASIPGAQILVTPGTANSGPGASNSVQVQVQGPDMKTLEILSNQVEDIMKKTPGLEYVNNSLAQGTPDYQLNIDHNALARYGLTAQQVESALRTAIQGTVASSFYQGDEQTDIVVQLPESFARDINHLSEISVMNSQGSLVPILQVASLTTSQEPPQISHVNGERSVTVSATVYGVTSGRIQAQLMKDFQTMRIPSGYSVGFGQNGKFLSNTLVDLGLSVVFSILLLYMVMASLFESVLTPFVIMFSLPPTFIGAALGLLLTHRSLNIDSAIGVIMVMGLIANNAIVLVDYTNQLRATGMSLRDALLMAGPIRLRPILMSTLTTVLAMMPLVIGYGTGAETMASMATVIAFGLTFSTLVTLVLVPVMYVILDNWIQRIRRWTHRGPRIARSSPDSTLNV